MAYEETRNTDEAELEARHRQGEALFTRLVYIKPGADVKSKGYIQLGRGEIMRGAVQIVKKSGGENNLHYHTNVETFWWVLKGRVRFYGPEDVLLGEFGPNEGFITPRYSRYWFEGASDEDLEILQIAASDLPGHKSGRTDVKPKTETFKTSVHVDLSEKKKAAG